jgi:hypothetical protein
MNSSFARARGGTFSLGSLQYAPGCLQRFADVCLDGLGPCRGGLRPQVAGGISVDVLVDCDVLCNKQLRM